MSQSRPFHFQTSLFFTPVSNPSIFLASRYTQYKPIASSLSRNLKRRWIVTSNVLRRFHLSLAPYSVLHAGSKGRRRLVGQRNEGEYS